MAFISQHFTVHLAWCKINITDGSDLLLPVDDLQITAKPIVQGETGGRTVVEDVNNKPHYKAEGWRHDIQMSYRTIPQGHHDTLHQVVKEFHSDTGSNTGEGTWRPSNSSGDVDSTRAIDVVAAFDESAVTAVFNQRGRGRPATLRFHEKTPQSSPYAWLTD
jgi:hypothetical protein